MSPLNQTQETKMYSLNIVGHIIYHGFGGIDVIYQSTGDIFTINSSLTPDFEFGPADGRSFKKDL